MISIETIDGITFILNALFAIGAGLLAAGLAGAIAAHLGATDWEKEPEVIDSDYSNRA